MIDLATSMLEQKEKLTNSNERLGRLREAVGRPVDTSPAQWLQIYSLTLGFAPDLVLEFGRGYGNSTCIFGEAIARLGNGRLVSVGYDSEHCWETKTVPRLKNLVSPPWFESMEIVQGDIMKTDLSGYLSDAKRLLLFWDAHGIDLAYHILGNTLPSLERKENLVLVHDMTDSRYNPTDTSYSDTPQPNIWMGPIFSSEEEIIPLYEFLSRNAIIFDTPGDSIQRLLYGGGTVPTREGEELKKLWEGLTVSYRNCNLQESNWLYFSLDNRTSGLPLAFPPTRSSRQLPLGERMRSTLRKLTP